MLGFQTILLACLAAGALFAYGRFRSPKRDRAAELFAEICQEREALSRAMATLPEQLELARRARLAAAEAAAVSAGSGGHVGSRRDSESGGHSESSGHSGSSRSWLSELEADLADATAIGAQLPSADVERAGPTGMELDLRLAEILTLSIRANRIANKYRLPAGDEPSAESTDARTNGGNETLRAAPPPRASQSSLSSIAPS